MFRSFEELILRFEFPEPRNRWDSPMFVVQPDDPEPPNEAIYNGLFGREPPPQNLATKPVCGCEG